MVYSRIEEVDVQEGAILLVDKPLRWTSFDVVNKIKYEIQRQSGCKKFKIGHAGTLDPLATGLLIVCIGKYTKQIPEIQQQRKQYEGTFTVGATTTSHDLEKIPENFMPYNNVNEDDILSVVEKFKGTIEQYPPIFSAVKFKGKRAFEYARNETEITLQAKQVTVYSFDITRIELPEIDFNIMCGKGTYIRSIARDFGDELGCGAYLSRLRRTKTGDFSVENALDMTPFINPDRIKNGKRRGFE